MRRPLRLLSSKSLLLLFAAQVFLQLTGAHLQPPAAVPASAIYLWL